jgi:HSP20 family molecular chaperone IbpA
MIRLGSSVNVNNEKDKYIVHFALPHRDLANVKVDYENGELRLSASEQKKTQNGSAPNTMESFERSRYEEAISIPGPVKENEMKVDRQANAVIVTLPKA